MFKPRGALAYIERNSQWSFCIHPHKVKGAMIWTHDTHGNISESFTFKRVIGYYWRPTRTKDVTYFCRTCTSCQLLRLLKPTVCLNSLLQLQPLDMLGIDFIGLFTPLSRGIRYIMIIVDYFIIFL